MGGGGICAGSGSRVRCRVCRVVRSEARDAVGEEMALEVGSMVRGRRVKVSSILGGVVSYGLWRGGSMGGRMAARAMELPGRL